MLHVTHDIVLGVVVCVVFVYKQTLITLLYTALHCTALNNTNTQTRTHTLLYIGTLFTHTSIQYRLLKYYLYQLALAVQDQNTFVLKKLYHNSKVEEKQSLGCFNLDLCGRNLIFKGWPLSIRLSTIGPTGTYTNSYRRVAN